MILLSLARGSNHYPAFLKGRVTWLGKGIAEEEAAGCVAIAIHVSAAGATATVVVAAVTQAAAAIPDAAR